MLLYTFVHPYTNKFNENLKFVSLYPFARSSRNAFKNQSAHSITLIELEQLFQLTG